MACTRRSITRLRLVPRAERVRTHDDVPRTFGGTMAKDSFTSLFGKAKKWAEQELKNATSLSSDARKTRAAEEANQELGRQVERDAQLQVVEALLPQSVKDHRDQAQADRARRAGEADS